MERKWGEGDEKEGLEHEDGWWNEFRETGELGIGVIRAAVTACCKFTFHDKT